ncbi:Cytochrome c-type biogenesis protein CcmG/DsbE, thiol:disulfide oxidoreductase [hydrothermal vent metagenome]|uniref:Cytochrome c-type biogenesis protein CcmG/DsbE, thiol:disulfide oxidoreductase n=1 Tax=hydrothermal vent metagenome TaxID=652676 RepID=A0A3B0TX45_9ZZZZ
MKRALLLTVPLILVIAMVALFATQIGRNTSLLPSVLINKPVPQFTLGPVAGIKEAIGDIPGFSTEDLKGDVFVVNVFASWCLACRQEHPLLMDLKSRNIARVYGINQKDAPENAISYLKELGNPYDAIGSDFNGRASIEWGVYGVPETFVVNPDGIITYKFIGAFTPQTYKTGLLAAIESARTGVPIPKTQ